MNHSKVCCAASTAKSRNLQKVAARRRAQIRAEKEEQKKYLKPIKRYGRR